MYKFRRTHNRVIKHGDTFSPHQSCQIEKLKIGKISEIFCWKSGKERKVDF